MNHPATTTAKLPGPLADLMTPVDVSQYLGVPPGTLATGDTSVGDRPSFGSAATFATGPPM